MKNHKMLFLGFIITIMFSLSNITIIQSDLSFNARIGDKSTETILGLNIKAQNQYNECSKILLIFKKDTMKAINTFDNSETNNQTYYYVLKANNAVSDGTNSNEVSTTQVTVPSAPQSLNATSGNGFVYLSWSAPISEGGSALTNYTIFRSLTNGSGYVLLTNVSAFTLSYTDNSVKNGQTYYYVVRANNAAGASNYSNQVVGQPTLYPSSKKDSLPYALLVVLVIFVFLTFFNQWRKKRK